MSEHETVPVRLDARSYDIVIGPGLIARAASHIAPYIRAPRVIIITDAHVGPLYAKPLAADCAARGMRCDTLTLPAGEATKSFTQFEKLLNDLLALKPDRKTTLIALGGGVIGDITGFAASVLLRGVDFIQIPTSLLAQVDSSVGGKTGINTAHGKNLVGSFYQPKRVLIDTATLQTLPPRELRAGYAEILKYGLIGNPDFYQWLLRHGGEILAGDTPSLAKAIGESCRMKAAIVSADEREGDVRALLNFGHTFGHALEAECGYNDLLVHGEAVAVGMVMACRLSEKLGYLNRTVGDGLIQHLRAVGLPATPRDIRADWDANRLLAHMYGDKKAENGTLTFIVLKNLGEAVVVKDVAETLALDTLKECLT
jgi:3-dehydroquinate synthase